MHTKMLEKSPWDKDKDCFFHAKQENCQKRMIQFSWKTKAREIESTTTSLLVESSAMFLEPGVYIHIVKTPTPQHLGRCYKRQQSRYRTKRQRKSQNTFGEEQETKEKKKK